jgi:hypothetical protein
MFVRLAFCGTMGNNHNYWNKSKRFKLFAYQRPSACLEPGQVQLVLFGVKLDLEVYQIRFSEFSAHGPNVCVQYDSRCDVVCYSWKYQ